MDGWSIQYASAAGTTWTNKVDLQRIDPVRRALPDRAVGGARPGRRCPRPTPPAAILMSATNGKVALVTSTTPLTACGTDCSACRRCATSRATAPRTTSRAPAPSPRSTPRTPASATTAAARTPTTTPPTSRARRPRRATRRRRRCRAPARSCRSPTCGGPLAVVAGDPATRAVSATDPDGRVTGLALTGTVPGIALTGVTPSAADGQPATGTVTVGAAVPAGTYATTLTATGADGETGACTLTITVAAFDATPIGAIQGSGYASPLTGQTRPHRGRSSPASTTRSASRPAASSPRTAASTSRTRATATRPPRTASSSPRSSTRT